LSIHSLVRPVANPLILAAAANGVDRAISATGTRSHRVFELAGVDPALIADSSLRLELTDYCRLFDIAARETGDDFFGARFGQWFTPAHFSALGALVVSSPTLGDALSTLARYYRWIQENSRLEFNVHKGFASLEYQICDGRIPHKHQDAELTMAALCGLIRHFLGPAWKPLETHFEHRRGGAGSEYKRVFGDTVFDRTTNAILIDSKLLELPMPQRSARAFAEVHVLVRHQLMSMDREASLRKDPDTTLGLLTHVIESQCKKGEPSIGAVARQMGLAVHGLRRQLRECNVAFDELLLSVRQRVALRLVEESDCDLTAIALMLGYSELSAFSRAFKRWHGHSASAYRRRAFDR
jgi:AraC-like DNA-binding protein